MPWRDAPSPYHVWLSEIMLQQTRIEAAKAYYERFIKRLPDVKALAQVPEEELLKLWEGLGYYNRARNLQKAAKVIVERYEGRIPADYDLLLNLPGIGSYTAGAIASIAYGIAASAVDGNVLRVTMRYLGSEDDISKMSVRKKMERSILTVIPKDKPGEFNQAVMELGEVICIPNGMPLCEECPLADGCQAKREGKQTELPVKPEKKRRRIEKRTLLILEWEGQIGIARRKPTGLLAGLWEFPSMEGHLSLKDIEQFLNKNGISGTKIERMKSGKHIFSHVEWHMRGYHIVLSPDQVPEDKTQDIVPDVIWTEKEELEKTYAIPVAFHSFLRQIIR
ncbi:MAG: A/G-specific adenine glycosylase [Lachnospiraceae bacterium]|nr:A/G-specific adenine glycosylase [Lachnospiraceae bacterium]